MRALLEKEDEKLLAKERESSFDEKLVAIDSRAVSLSLDIFAEDVNLGSRL